MDNYGIIRLIWLAIEVWIFSEPLLLAAFQKKNVDGKWILCISLFNYAAVQYLCDSRFSAPFEDLALGNGIASAYFGFVHLAFLSLFPIKLYFYEKSGIRLNWRAIVFVTLGTLLAGVGMIAAIDLRIEADALNGILKG